MLSKSVIESILDKACMMGADFAEVFDENTLYQEVNGSADGIDSSRVGRENGVGIRLFKDGNCFYGFTNKRDEAELLKLVKQLAKSMRGNGAIAPLSEKSKYDMGAGIIPASSLSSEKRLRPLRDCIRAGMEYDAQIVQMKVKLTDMEQSVQIANSEGLFVEDFREKTRLYIGAFAQEGTDAQHGYYGPGAMRGHEFYDMIDVEASGREAARQAKVLLHAKPCKGGQMPVVVANGFGGLLFHEACGHSLEARVIAHGASEFCNKLGEKVASDVVTLIDDGSIANEWGSLHVDDEGIPTQKNILIENGILKGYMIDRLNGMHMGMAPTGSSRRQSYKFVPTSRMTNTYIAPGSSTPQEIIKATERGLFVSSIIGGSVQPATGDFNFAAGECYLIENGEITVPVRGITLIGNGGTVLKSVDMVGNNYELRQGFCFASSGALFIGAGQPTIRVSNMTVGGGQK